MIALSDIATALAVIRVGNSADGRVRAARYRRVHARPAGGTRRRALDVRPAPWDQLGWTSRKVRA